MDCSTAREAISATLDGEPAGVPAADLEHHLATCSSCAEWRNRAAELARRSRLTKVDPVPDLSDAILARITLPKRRTRRVRRTPSTPDPYRLPWLRILLAVIAAVQIGIGLGQFFVPMLGHAGHHGGEQMFGGHVGREAAAFNIAIGAGMLWVALHPRRALDQLPLLGTLAILLGLVSAFDLGSGDVGWSRLSTHLPVLLATIVVLALHHRQPTPVDPEATRVGEYAEPPAAPYEESSTRIRSEPSTRDPDPPAAAERRNVA